MRLDPCEMLPRGPLGLMPQESDLLLSPMALDYPPTSPHRRPGPLGMGRVEWPPGWLAGQGGLHFWELCGGSTLFEPGAGRQGCCWPLGDASCLPQVLPLGEGAGTGPRLWAGLGTFLRTLPWLGSSSHPAD